MPRRNFHLLWIFALVALVCHLRVDRYGRLLADTMNRIGQRYLEPIDDNELMQGAIEGMVNRLDEKFDDEYSTYIPPAEVPEFEETINQEFGGVGIEITLPEETQQLTVISPLYGSPAYEAGILAGDRILKINGRTTHGLSIKAAVERLRGKLGEPVVLTVLHEGKKDPVDLTLVRAVVKVNTVLGDTRNADGSWNYFIEGRDRIGYLRITSFTENTADEMREALQWLVDHKMRGLILDVRNDPGGYLDTAVEICDMFIESGVIVTIRRRFGEVFQTFDARAEGTYSGFPMAVLVNKFSASASEIVAACLQDHHRAAIIGQRTFGKGTIQELIDLDPDRGMLKLTTASYWRPSGKNINRRKAAGENDDWGVRPDVGYQVNVDGDALTKLTQARVQRDVYRSPNSNGVKTGPKEPLIAVDSQLAKAVEYVEGKR
jgi:carboxyl-terminal processing protease